jgi:S-adenosylmethionine hydrolase
MIATFTDFGVAGPYLGELRIALQRCAPDIAVIDLMSDAPRFNPRASAYLLAAVAQRLPPNCVVLAVVDPGVGGGREPVALYADTRWYVGPDNGLLDVVSMRAEDSTWWRIRWRPDELSNSFHGRDLFAPVAARLALGEPLPKSYIEHITRRSKAPPPDIAEVVYLDGYGNAVSGLRAQAVHPESTLNVHGTSIDGARTFSAVPVGQPFWYENSMGLVEVAANQGSAADMLQMEIGTLVEVKPAP